MKKSLAGSQLKTWLKKMRFAKERLKMIYLNVQTASVTAKNGSLNFHGKCDKDLIIFSWGDTGTIEMRKEIEKSKCFWSVKVDKEIESGTERGLGAKEFEEKVRSLKFDSLGYISFIKDSTNIEIFLSQKSHAAFQYLFDKFIASKDLMFEIWTNDFFELSSSTNDSKIPTLDEFYNNELGLLVSDISFTLKHKANT